MRPPIFYITNDPERALGLESTLRNFHIVCVDDSPIISKLRENGVKVFSLAQARGEKNPIRRSAYRLLQQKEVQDYIASEMLNFHRSAQSVSVGRYIPGLAQIPTVIDSNRPAIMVFKPSRQIERLADKLGFQLLNPASEITARIEGKISQLELFQKYEISMPRAISGILGERTYDELVDYIYSNRGLKRNTQNAEISAPLVLQFDKGHSGTGTHFIKSKDEFMKLQERYPQAMVKISEYIEGETWTFNAVQTRVGTLFGGLSMQITGDPRLTPYISGGTVGNDWSKAGEIAETTRELLKQELEKISTLLEKESFRGMFGVDFMVRADGSPVIIEINARQTASVSMHAKLDLRRGLVPLEAFHVIEMLLPVNVCTNEFYDFLNENFIDSGRVKLENSQRFDFTSVKDYIKRYNEKLFEPLHAWQILARNTSDEPITLKVGATCEVWNSKRAAEDLAKVYDVEALADGEICYRRLATGQTVSPGMEVARVQGVGAEREERWVEGLVRELQPQPHA